MAVERYYVLFDGLMEKWDAENVDHLPMDRAAALDYYFVNILKSVPDIEKIEFVNEYFDRRAENTL